MPKHPAKITHPAYYGCYNELTDEKRKEKFYKQWKNRGFDSSVSWNLYLVIAQFVKPRLEVLRDENISYPANLTPDKWTDILNKMIEAFDLVIHMDDWQYTEKANDNYKKCQKGLKLFTKYYFDLWD